MNTIACFGDSLIEGFPFAPENSWIAQVKKNTGIRILNHGICGECCDDIKDRLVWRPLPKEVNHVLFEGGMNDIIQGCPLYISRILRDGKYTRPYMAAVKDGLNRVEKC